MTKISLNNFINGCSEYITCEIAPHMVPTIAFGMGVGVRLLGKKAQNIGMNIKPYLKMMDVMDESNMIEIDDLFASISEEMIEKKHLTVSIPVVGELKFNEADVLKLKEYIMKYNVGGTTV